MKNKILLASLIFCFAVLTALYLKARSLDQKLSQIPLGGDFSIPATNGEFVLSDHKGKMVLLYFGFTFCPDVCPTTLSTVSGVLKKLSESELARLKVLFISVDPKRDDLNKIKNYVDFFHPSIIGATDTEKKVGEIAKLYGVAFEKYYPKQDDDNYTIDHSTSMFLIDRNNKIVELIGHGESVAQIYERLIKYIKD
jgi:protein SCO1